MKQASCLIVVVEGIIYQPFVIVRLKNVAASPEFNWKIGQELFVTSAEKLKLTKSGAAWPMRIFMKGHAFGKLMTFSLQVFFFPVPARTKRTGNSRFWQNQV